MVSSIKFQFVDRRRRDGGPAGRRAGQPHGRRADPPGDPPPPGPRGDRAQPDQGGDPRGRRRGQPGDPGQLRRGHRVHQHGDDGGAGPVPQRPGLRGRDRGFPRTASATDGSSGSPRTTRWPTPCSRPARSPPRSSRPTNSRMCCTSTSAARMLGADRKTSGSSTSGRAIGCSWPATGSPGSSRDPDLKQVLATTDDPQQAAVTLKDMRRRTTPRTTSPA